MMKNIGNDVIEYEKLCFEVVGNVSDFAASGHVTCMEKVHDHLLDKEFHPTSTAFQRAVQILFDLSKSLK